MSLSGKFTVSLEKVMQPSVDRLQETFDAYHRWYWEDAQLWNRTTFLGVPCLKSVLDMWNYQEILTRMNPALVVELGAYRGGATLFFSVLMEHIRPDGRILCVDVKTDRIVAEVKARYNVAVVEMSSIDSHLKDTISDIRSTLTGPAFFILDSLHSRDHVLAELMLLRHVTVGGDYVVVEDTNLNGHPIQPQHGDGPYEAVLAYEATYPSDYVHDSEAACKFGFSFAPRGFLVRQ